LIHFAAEKRNVAGAEDVPIKYLKVKIKKPPRLNWGGLLLKDFLHYFLMIFWIAVSPLQIADNI